MKLSREAVGGGGSCEKTGTGVKMCILSSKKRLLYLNTRSLRCGAACLFCWLQVHDEKQVLIVGTMGSGTKQMSRELARLGLEVGHEASDSTSQLCRDGTISWVHAIRFLR